MVHAIKQEIIVQTDNTIEIHSSALKLGAHVEVILLLQEDKKPSKKPNLCSFIGKGKGSFSSPREADQFIRAERNTWE